MVRTGRQCSGPHRACVTPGSCATRVGPWAPVIVFLILVVVVVLILVVLCFPRLDLLCAFLSILVAVRVPSNTAQSIFPHPHARVAPAAPAPCIVRHWLGVHTYIPHWCECLSL